ncbi:hypothetical protein GCM10007901_06250 [Dyella acidisoli]|uniref:Uncharacterized protein n=1 Tax=Dyella acidisoli TaxID=1867834 RepID=A0ABQ5XJ09_9GAMM|nr:hypothetical protein [Dyella acidisoli]GLQ91675.1 hypothetical protein GCM10007901_06250 [Dyella acidisoli]
MGEKRERRKTMQCQSPGDVLAMLADGSWAYQEMARDLLAGQSLADKPEHMPLAIAKRSQQLAVLGSGRIDLLGVASYRSSLCIYAYGVGG